MELSETIPKQLNGITTFNGSNENSGPKNDAERSASTWFVSGIIRYKMDLIGWLLHVYNNHCHYLMLVSH